MLLFWEKLVQNIYSNAPNEVFRMPNRAPYKDLYFFRIEPKYIKNLIMLTMSFKRE